MHFLNTEIGRRIRNERIAKKLNKSEVLEDRTLLRHIEEGTLKPRNATFIPDKQLEALGVALQLTKSQIIFGTMDDVTKLVRFVYDKVAYSYKVSPQAHKAIDPNSIIGKDYWEDVNMTSDKLHKKAFMQWANYGEMWFSGLIETFEYAIDEGQSTGYPAFETIDERIFTNTIDRYWEQNQYTIINSFKDKFVNDNISLKGFDKKITQWINRELSAIIDESITYGEKNEVYERGYLVAENMTKVLQKIVQLRFNDAELIDESKTIFKNEFLPDVQRKIRYPKIFIQEIELYTNMAKAFADMQRQIFKSEGTEIL